MAKLEYRDVADDTFRVANGSGGAVHVKVIADGAVASDGLVIDTTGAQVLSYTGDKLTYIEVEFGGETYRQTFTYTGDNLTGVSVWTLQA